MWCHARTDEGWGRTGDVGAYAWFKVYYGTFRTSTNTKKQESTPWTVNVEGSTMVPLGCLLSCIFVPAHPNGYVQAIWKTICCISVQTLGKFNSWIGWIQSVASYFLLWGIITALQTGQPWFGQWHGRPGLGWDMALGHGRPSGRKGGSGCCHASRHKVGGGGGGLVPRFRESQRNVTWNLTSDRSK